MIAHLFRRLQTAFRRSSDAPTHTPPYTPCECVKHTRRLKDARACSPTRFSFTPYSKSSLHTGRHPAGRRVSDV